MTDEATANDVPVPGSTKVPKYPRVFAAVSPALRGEIERLRDVFSGADGGRATISEVLRQLLIGGFVLLDREFVDVASEICRESKMSMDDAWRALLRDGIAARTAKRTPPR